MRWWIAPKRRVVGSGSLGEFEGVASWVWAARMALGG